MLHNMNYEGASRIASALNVTGGFLANTDGPRGAKLAALPELTALMTSIASANVPADVRKDAGTFTETFGSGVAATQNDVKNDVKYASGPVLGNGARAVRSASPSPSGVR